MKTRGPPRRRPGSWSPVGGPLGRSGGEASHGPPAHPRGTEVLAVCSPALKSAAGRPTPIL